MNTKILSILTLIIVFISQADDSVFSCERVGNSSINGHLRVPISINIRSGRYVELLERVSGLQNNRKYGQLGHIKETRAEIRKIQIAIDKAGGNLGLAAIIYYAVPREDQADKDKIASLKNAFIQRAKKYNQLGYARDVRDIVKRIRIAIRRTKGHISQASKEYDPRVKKMKFYVLVRRYGQEEYRESVIKDNIRYAIDKGGGNLAEASRTYYKSKAQKKEAFWALVEHHHLLTYTEAVRRKVKGIRAAIQKTRGNLRDAAEIYYARADLSTTSKRTMFLGLVHRYGQSHFREDVIIDNIRGAIDEAGGDILAASKIFYGKANSKDFYYLAKRHKQLRYSREVRAIAERLRNAIRKSKGAILLASNIYGNLSQESFENLLKRYGQWGYKEELIRGYLRDAIDRAQGDRLKAAVIYYVTKHHGHSKSVRSRYRAFYGLLKTHGLLDYADQVKGRSRGKHQPALPHSYHPRRIRTHI